MNLGPPKQPADLSIFVKAPTVLEAKWTAVEDCEVVSYVVTVFIEGEMTSITSNTTNMTDYNITGLCPDTTYNVSVTAISNAGSSSSSSMVEMTNGTGNLYNTVTLLMLYVWYFAKKVSTKFTNIHSSRWFANCS